MGNKIRYYKQNGEEYSFSKEQQIKITQTSNADMNIGILKKQTAVEWLYDRFLFAGYATPSEWKEQAKAMEKEQIINAYLEGESDAEHLINSGKNYYNQTYGK